MKKHLKQLFLKLEKSFNRFPIVIILATIISFILIYLNESACSMETRDILGNVVLTLTLGIFMFLFLYLLSENLIVRFGKKSKMFPFSIGATVFLVAVYFYFFKDNVPFYDIGTKKSYQFFTLLFSFVSGCTWIGRIKIKDDYIGYVLSGIYAIAIAIIYSIVMMMGLSGIYFALDKLFEIETSGWYLNTAYMVFIPFYTASFLAYFPYATGEEYEMSRMFKVMLLYIVTPLLMVYMLILYVYSAKILILTSWPEGKVFPLVLGFLIVMVVNVFLISKIESEGAYQTFIKRFLPIASLPLIIMMFISMHIRISEYGITMSRQSAVTVGIWLTASAVYYTIRRHGENMFVPITLTFFIFFNGIGYFSSYNVTVRNQNTRFISLLNANDMIKYGEIIPNSNVREEEQKKIYDIVEFMYYDMEIKDLYGLNEDFEMNNFKDIFGFSADTHEETSDNYFFDINSNTSDNKSFDTSSYNTFYYFNFIKLDEKLHLKETIKTADNKEFTVDIPLENEFKQWSKEYKDEKPKSDITVKYEDDKATYFLIINYASGQSTLDQNTREIEITNAELSGYLFYKLK